MQTQRLLSSAIFGVTTLLGAAAFLYPFWLPAVAAADAGDMAHSSDAALMATILAGLCFLVLLLEAQSQTISAKSIALLGVLVAINSVLRFAETVVPGPGGFSPIFLLIILGGYVFGARFGFLLGALTILVSGFVTGGVGPWLPYQMFTAGWIGMSAPLCRPMVRGLARLGAPAAPTEVAVIVLFSGAWGLLFGVIMNLWFWPFVVGPSQQYWQPGIDLAETVRRYAVFYLATSFVWDAMRSLGNMALMALAAAPTVRLLRRFHQRFDFSYTPTPSSASAAPLAPTAPAPVGGQA
jgi:energy-coupling factor transport system substrate-specific component